MIDYQITSTVIGVALALVILFMVRRDHLHGPYAVWWLSIAAGVIVLGVFPRIIDKFGDMLGINYPPILAVILALCLVLLRMMRMDVERSDQERRMRRLTQKMAVLEQMMRAQQDEDSRS